MLAPVPPDVEDHRQETLAWSEAIGRALDLPLPQQHALMYGAFLHVAGRSGGRDDTPAAARRAAQQVARLGVLPDAAALLRGWCKEVPPSGDGLSLAVQALAAAHVAASATASGAHVAEALRAAGRRWDPSVLAGALEVAAGPHPGRETAAAVRLRLRARVAHAGHVAAPDAQAAHLADAWRAVSEVGRTFARSLDLDRVLDLVCRSVADLTESAVRLFLISEDRSRFLPAAQCGIPRGMPWDDLGTPSSVAWAVLLAGVPYRRALSDTRASPGVTAYLRARGLTSLLTVPLVAGDEPVGKISVWCDEDTEFDTDDLEWLGALAGQAALAIRNAQLYRAASARLAEIRHLHQLLDGALDNAGLSVLAINRDLRVVYASAPARRAVAQLLATAEPVVVGRRLDEIMGDYAERSPLVTALREDRSVELPSVPAREDPAIRLHLVALPLHGDDGAVSGAMSLAWNVSEAAAVAERLHHVERLALAGELAAATIHEVRNPLAGLRCYLDLARQRPDQADRYLELAGREIDAVNRLLEDSLSVVHARPRQPQPADLVRLARDAWQLLEPVAMGRRVTVDWQAASTLPSALVDPDEVRECYLNLLANAVQAMPQGGSVVVSFAADATSVVTTIADTGPGMTPEVLENLFRPFFTTKPGGTGLGLVVTRRLASENGGSITIESQADKGTAVTLRLPVAPSP